MTDRVMLDWQVPTPEWERFREHIQDEHGSLRGYLGEAAETAMIEYAALDNYGSVESKIHSLVEAAGRRPFKEKNSLTGDELAASEKTRVTAKVKPEVKAGFREEVRNSENPFGVEFARAIRQYREHPREERLNEELDRVLDDAQRLLADLQDDVDDQDEASDDNSSESLSLAERKTIAVSNELGDQFTDDELKDTIEHVAEVSSDPSIEKYRGRVVDRLGMERHPNAPHLWVPHEVADQIAAGKPREIRQPVDRLDREERVRRIQLAVGRAAASRDSGEVRVQTPVIQEQVLDGDVSRTTTLSLMRAAKLPSGVGIDVDDDTQPAALEVDMGMITEVDTELASAILNYRDKADDGLLSSPTSTTVNDYVDGPGDVPAENARAFSDGGSYRGRNLEGVPGFGSGDDDEDGGCDD